MVKTGIRCKLPSLTCKSLELTDLTHDRRNHRGVFVNRSDTEHSVLAAFGLAEYRMDMFEQEAGADDLTSTFFPIDDLAGDDASGYAQGGDDGASHGQGGTDGGPNGANGGGGGQTTPPGATSPTPDPGPPSSPPTDPSAPQVQTLWGSVDASNMPTNAFGGPGFLGANNVDTTSTDWQSEPFPSQFVPPVPPPPPVTPPLPMPSFQSFGASFGAQDMLNTNLANISAMNGFPPPVTDPTYTDTTTGPAVYGVATAQGTINTIDPTSDPNYMGPGTFFTPNGSAPLDAASAAV